MIIGVKLSIIALNMKTYQVLASGGIGYPDFGSIDDFPFFCARLNVSVIADFFSVINSFAHFVTFSPKKDGLKLSLLLNQLVTFV